MSSKMPVAAPWTSTVAGLKKGSKLVSKQGSNNNAMSGKTPAPKTPPFAGSSKPPVTKGKSAKKGK